MITADNLTDAEIQKLRSTTTDPQIADCCETALGIGSPIWMIKQSAREAVAEELNRLAGVEMQHVSKIEHETRGVELFNTEHHLYHRWSCSCGAAGPWGHALWAKLSVEAAERGAAQHVDHARAMSGGAE